MSNPEVERTLVRWGQYNALRDGLFLGAIKAGVSKNRIHVLTGVSRTTINRIIEQAKEETCSTP